MDFLRPYNITPCYIFQYQTVSKQYRVRKEKEKIEKSSILPSI